MSEVSNKRFVHFDGTKQVVKEESLCLPIAALLNNALASKIVKAIKDIQVVNMAATKLTPTNSQESFSATQKP